ncbi:hypothetical protein N781_16315 [Pontibacillus halophilus JSM 076056 = DSM 19796]|uniref:IDEAL domain-containing protein n=1 Tax=Pontibacillus halophilus JSM 076056 = DSM 19796 TaxID=1385510 RepID=A0A0A5GKI8_9BACI|nr:hypothetical protein [Pontibacillus halophilus]KGX92484.1 hypothetical protein N781_16315 [Pontibacillus halophilus JSM 076056 = DSM 19796]
MYNQFVVKQTFTHHVDYVYSLLESNLEETFQEGDLISLLGERKYVEPHGWYFLIDVNGERQLYLSIRDLESFYEKQWFRSYFDLELEENYLTYKINEALDQKQPVQFEVYAAQLKRVKEHLNQETLPA